MVLLEESNIEPLSRQRCSHSELAGAGANVVPCKPSSLDGFALR
jgi:hypothetical protein